MHPHGQISPRAAFKFHTTTYPSRWSFPESLPSESVLILALPLLQSRCSSSGCFTATIAPKTLPLKVAILLRIHNVSSVDPVANFARTEDEKGFPTLLCTRYRIPDPTDTEFNVFSRSTGRKWVDLDFAVSGQQIQFKMIRKKHNICNHLKLRVATSKAGVSTLNHMAYRPRAVYVQLVLAGSGLYQIGVDF